MELICLYNGRNVVLLSTSPTLLLTTTGRPNHPLSVCSISMLARSGCASPRGLVAVIQEDHTCRWRRLPLNLRSRNGTRHERCRTRRRLYYVARYAYDCCGGLLQLFYTQPIIQHLTIAVVESGRASAWYETTLLVCWRSRAGEYNYQCSMSRGGRRFDCEPIGVLPLNQLSSIPIVGPSFRRSAESSTCMVLLSVRVVSLLHFLSVQHFDSQNSRA